MKIFIVGHISPDLDSVVSAVEYAEFLKKSKRYGDAEIVPVKTEDANAETSFVFKKFGVEMPKNLDEFDVESSDAFILVDHNEEVQRHTKVVGDQVIEIVDHHKINVNFTSPVRIDVKPVGSTSTIIHELFEMQGIKPSEGVAGLMLAGILSDTVGLKSSTTTGLDSDAARNIAEANQIDVEKFTFEIFKAKSDITGLAPKEIAMKDYKVFDFGGKKVFINQVETVEPTKIFEQKDAIVAVLDDVKSEVGASQAYVVVTDILKINSQVIYSNEVEKEVVERAFTTEGANNSADIGPKMSRKKDIAPAIEKAIVG